jgi:uncharacterized SAM-binding protein YcdF (DUF218 family)
MSLDSDIEEPPVPRRHRAAWIAAALVMAAGIGFVAAGIGFVAYLAQLRAEELKPSLRADGIVVLTGGSSRVADALELLEQGFGQRLLISGVHPTNGVGAISRSLPEAERLLACCVDLDHSAVNTRSNALETERWVRERGFKSLIVVTSNYHMPRAIVEMKHAMPDIHLIPFSVIGERWREEAWWTNGATMRLLLYEYAKYVAAETRVKLASLAGDLLAGERGTHAPSRRAMNATG